MKKNSLRIILIFLICLCATVGIWFWLMSKKNKNSDTYRKLKDPPVQPGIPIPNPDDSPPIIPIPQDNPTFYETPFIFTKLFKDILPSDFTNSFGQRITPRGRNQTIAITASFLSVWKADTIVRAMRSAGIQNKAVGHIINQVSFVDATTFEGQTFDYKAPSGREYTELKVPLSDGLHSRVEYSDAISGSTELELALQCIFSALPDANVIIFYYGFNPMICPPMGPDDLPDSSNIGLVEAYDAVIKALYSKVLSKAASEKDYIQIFINLVVFDILSEEIVGEIELYFRQLRESHGVQSITMSGFRGSMDANPGYQTIPTVFSSLLRIGSLRLEIVNNDDGSTRIEPRADEFSNGGFFNKEKNNGRYQTRVPYFQYGHVPDDVEGRGNYYVGTPDASACCSNLSAIFSSNPDFNRTVRSMHTPAILYAVIIAMVNNITNYNGWDYQSIFYKQSDYLFEYVSRGNNLVYKADNYKHWNPCSGFGILNGNRLAKLLDTRYIFHGLPIQLSSACIFEQMSYLNAYPLPFLRDPIFKREETLDNDSAASGNEISVPCFGPQSLWSEFFMYHVVLDPESGEFKIQSEPQVYPIQNKSLVVIKSRQTNSTDLVLSLSPSKHLCFVSNPNIHPGQRVPINYVWAVYCEDKDDTYLQYFSNIYIQSWFQQEEWLSAEFQYSQAPTTVSQSSFTDKDIVIPLRFMVSPHVYYMIDGQYNKNIEESYYVNWTNSSEFILSGFNLNNYILGRHLCSSQPQRVQYRNSFDPYPEWLLVPHHKLPLAKEANKNFVGLLFGTYMLFNIKAQAYMFIREYQVDEDEEEYTAYEANIININYPHQPIWSNRKSFVFHIESGMEYSDFSIFHPRPVLNKPQEEINEFLAPVWISFENVYYTRDSPTGYSYTFDDQPEFDERLTQFLRVEPERSSTTNLYLFWVAEHLMMRISINEYMQPSRNQLQIMKKYYNNSGQLTSTKAVSTTNSQYVEMHDLDSESLAQKWAFFNTKSITYVYNMFTNFYFYPILNFVPTDFSKGFLITTMTNPIQECLIYSDSGNAWKPRKGDCGSEANMESNIWILEQNYLNVKPSEQLRDGITISSNYFYFNTLYHMSCSKGVLSDTIAGNRLGLLTMTDANKDTTYYNSLFIIKQ